LPPALPPETLPPAASIAFSPNRRRPAAASFPARARARGSTRRPPPRPPAAITAPGRGRPRGRTRTPRLSQSPPRGCPSPSPARRLHIRLRSRTPCRRRGITETLKRCLQPRERLVPLTLDLVEPATRLIEPAGIDLPDVIASDAGPARQAGVSQHV